MGEDAEEGTFAQRGTAVAALTSSVERAASMAESRLSCKIISSSCSFKDGASCLLRGDLGRPACGGAFGDLGDKIAGISASITSTSEAGAVKAVVRLKRPAISNLVFWVKVSRSSVDVCCSGLVEIV